MDKYEIIIPKISTNKIYSGVHWTKRKKDKDDFRNLFIGCTKLIKKPTIPCEINFEFNWKSRPLDCSNCFYMVKLIEDSLVHHGIIPDDSPKYVSRISVSSVKGKEDILKFWF